MVPGSKGIGRERKKERKEKRKTDRGNLDQEMKEE